MMQRASIKVLHMLPRLLRCLNTAMGAVIFFYPAIIGSQHQNEGTHVTLVVVRGATC